MSSDLEQDLLQQFRAARAQAGIETLPVHVPKHIDPSEREPMFLAILLEYLALGGDSEGRSWRVCAEESLDGCE